MRYCLVHVHSGKRILFLNKSELHSWILQHRVYFTPVYLSLFALHRVRMVSRSRYDLSARICSLVEYIVKHKLMEL